MPSRRSVLIAVALGGAGCMGPTAGPDPGDGAASGPNRTGPTNDRATQSDPAAESGDEQATDGDEPAETPVDPDPEGPVRAENDATSTRTVEDDENVELSESGEVRYVAAWRHTNGEAVRNGEEPPEREPVYETTDWERWAPIHARHAGATRAAAHAADELGLGDRDGISAGTSSDIVEDGTAAVVEISTTLDREGEVVSEPPVGFEELVAATPRTVAVTYVLEDREYETHVPIYVRYSVLHQQ